MIRKEKRLLLIMLTLSFLLICPVLFADAPATAFHLIHYININPDYHFEFKNPEGSSANSVILESSANQELAKLYLIHNRDVVVKSITVSSTDLVCDTDFYPYTMSIVNGEGTPIEWTADQEGHGSGSATIISGSYKFKYSQTRGSVLFAVFNISLDDTDVPPGTYEGTVTLEHEVI